MEVWPGQQDPSEQPVLTASIPAANLPPGSVHEKQQIELGMEGESHLPDFTGLTARQAVVETATLGLRVNLHGRGLVSRQMPSPGSSVEMADGRIELWLAGDAGR